MATPTSSTVGRSSDYNFLEECNIDDSASSNSKSSLSGSSGSTTPEIRKYGNKSVDVYPTDRSEVSPHLSKT
jgi:hypothetical protein